MNANRIGVGLLAVLVAGCSDTAAPDVNSVLNADVAVMAADGALESVGGRPVSAGC